jgi:tetratricopeptide (TPR) repeat protein
MASPRSRFVTVLFLALLVAVPVRAQQADYGSTEFPTSGAVEAQTPFLRGVLMLHSFEYVDARTAFQEAQRIDPDFAMAYWGEAMTHNHPIWMRQDRAAALAALEKLAPTPAEQLAKAPTEREKDYLHTLHVLFGAGQGEPASKEARDDAYAEAMGDLAARYPDDLDAQAFHALAILGTAHEGRDFATYMRAAAIAEEVFDVNPRHPGAAHYLIHAYDDPVHAPLGLRPARVYASVAPAASHALHMPSHIFFALGMWSRGAASNVDSYEAARTTTDRRGEPLNGHGYHALQWLAYARAQQGRYDDAWAVLDTARQHAAASEGIATGYERYVQHTFPVMVMLETERWDALDEYAIDAAALSPKMAATIRAAQGIAALRIGDRPAAEALLAKAQAAAEQAEAPEEAHIPVLQLRALLALDAGEEEAALVDLETAAAREDAMPLSFGPPWPLKPTHELFGEVLLALDRPTQAQAQFEQALERYPRRARSVWGRARAAAHSGDAEATQEARTALAAIWAEADPDVQARLQALPAMPSPAGSR